MAKESRHVMRKEPSSCDPWLRSGSQAKTNTRLCCCLQSVRSSTEEDTAARQVRWHICISLIKYFFSFMYYTIFNLASVFQHCGFVYIHMCFKVVKMKKLSSILVFKQGKYLKMDVWPVKVWNIFLWTISNHFRNVCRQLIRVKPVSLTWFDFFLLL